MEKAMICPYDKDTGAQISQGIRVPFNPASYSLRHANHYDNSKKGALSRRPEPQSFFLGRRPSVLDMELIYDTYDPSLSAIAMADVRQKINPLHKFVYVKSDKHAPPSAVFIWGTFQFAGNILSMDESYTMFLENGNPVRAKVRISMEGVDLSEPTLPNNSPDRTRRRTLIQGETLWKLANEEYGSPGAWRVIARANGILNPRLAPRATPLELPALPGGAAAGVPGLQGSLFGDGED